jgi:hypothetical protein
MKARAVSMFRKVVELKPGHEGAKAALEELEPEPTEEEPQSEGGGGLLKKLFGKR